MATGVAESAPAIAANQMFDLLGIRYLVFRETSDGPPGWSDPQYEEVYAGGGVKVYENTHVTSRAFVVHDVERVADQQAALRFLRNGEVGRFPDGSVQVTSKQMDQTAVIEAERGSAPTTRPCEGSEDTPRIVDRGTTSLTLKVRSECAGLLVVSGRVLSRLVGHRGWSQHAHLPNRRRAPRRGGPARDLHRRVPLSTRGSASAFSSRCSPSCWSLPSRSRRGRSNGVQRRGEQEPRRAERVPRKKTRLRVRHGVRGAKCSSKR